MEDFGLYSKKTSNFILTNDTASLKKYKNLQENRFNNNKLSNNSTITIA